MTPPKSVPAANNLDAFFMPFTANRQFKKNPRLLARAKGVHYWTPEGRQIIDGTAADHRIQLDMRMNSVFRLPADNPQATVTIVYTKTGDEGTTELAKK